MKINVTSGSRGRKSFPVIEAMPVEENMEKRLR